MTDSAGWLRLLSPTAAQSQLYSYLEAVLQFAATNIRQLDRKADLWREELDAYVNVADKVIIETALLLLVSARIPYQTGKISKLHAELLAQLAPLIRTERNRALLIRYPHTAAALGIGHIALTELGDHDAEFDLLIRRAFESGYVEAVERLPYRTMDVRWLRGLLYPKQPPAFDDLMTASILANRAHPIQLSVSDTYALTHALMYVTDFGTRLLPKGFDASELRANVDAALAYHLLSDNLDLLGELLMSAVMLGPPWSPYTAFGWSLLTTLWDQLSFLPSPTFDTEVYATLSNAEQASYTFRHLYHTMYVGGMLCSILLLQREDQPALTAWIPPTWNYLHAFKQCRRAVRLAADFCQDRVDDDEPRAQWHATQVNERANLDGYNPGRQVYNPEIQLTSISNAELNKVIEMVQNYSSALGRADAPWLQALSHVPCTRTEVAAILTDALLIHACQDYRLPLLADLLSKVAGFEAPLTITFREALAFFLRQQTPAGALGVYFVAKANYTGQQAVQVTAGLAQRLVPVMNRLEIASLSSSARVAYLP